MADLKPWEQQPGESDIAYGTFREFLASETPRDIGAFAELQGMSRSTFYTRSSKWEWTERARAWDNAQVQAADEAVISEAQRLAIKHMRAWDDVLELGTKGAQRLLERFDDPVACPECGEMIAPPYPPTPRETALLLEKATTFHRLIVGEVTDRTEQRQKLDLSSLSKEARAAARVLMDELGVDEI
jgi:hypothetical protein